MSYLVPKIFMISHWEGQHEAVMRTYPIENPLGFQILPIDETQVFIHRMIIRVVSFSSIPTFSLLTSIRMGGFGCISRHRRIDIIHKSKRLSVRKYYLRI